MTLIEQHIEFAEAAMIDDKRLKCTYARIYPGEYADVLIVDSNPQFWYAPFIGIIVFVELRFMTNSYGGRFLTDMVVTRLVGNRKIIGRSIDPSHAFIL